MEEGSERGALLALGAGRLPRLTRRFFALRLDITREELSGPEEEEEPSKMFKTEGSLEYEEEEVLEGVASRDDLLVPRVRFELEAGCLARGDGSEECGEAEDWALNVLHACTVLMAWESSRQKLSFTMSDNQIPRARARNEQLGNCHRSAHTGEGCEQYGPNLSARESHGIQAPSSGLGSEKRMRNLVDRRICK